MNKRGILLVFVLLVSLLLSSELVSAQSGTTFVIEKTIEGIEDFFGPLFGGLFGTDQYDEFLFARILLLFILIFLIRMALEQVPRLSNQLGVIWIVSIIISVLSVRYLSDFALIRGILVSYGALGVALTTILPFIIFFYFVHHSIKSGAGRKVAWIVYLIILIGIWANSYNQLNHISNYIYLALVVLAIILFLFDKKVREYMALSQVKNALDTIHSDSVVKAYKRYEDYLDMAHRNPQDPKWARQAEGLKKYLKKMGVTEI